MSKKMPPESAFKNAWVAAHPFYTTTPIEERVVEFDKFIAQVKADALKEAAKGWRTYTHTTDVSSPCPEWWLNKEASRIEEEA